MYGKHVAALAVLGALALTACSDQSGPENAGGTAPPVQAPPSAQVVPQEAGEPGPDGTSLYAGTAKANGAAASTGDLATGSDGTANTASVESATKWVQLRAGKAGVLDPVVVNGAGLTLYRFDKDTADPSRSTCDDACAKTWPPVTIAKGGKVFLAGVAKAAVGTVRRSDGALQLTIKGWPVYRFAKDRKPGDTLGQGVGGTWFGVTPNGQKAGPVTAPATITAPAVTTTTTASVTLKSTSAVLFDDKDFSDNGASQGVAGRGCVTVPRPATASSVSVLGSVKLWTGPDCTGKSELIRGDIADLATLGLDDSVRSVFFG